MASPRSFFSGTLRLGLLNIPITLGKTAVTTREPALKTVCNCGKGAGPHLIDRSERCVQGTPPEEIVKAKGVEKADGSFQILSEDQMSFIEESTKSDVLEVLEVVDLNPDNEADLNFMGYAMARTDVRPDKKNKAATQPFQILYEAMYAENLALVVKLCNATTQKLGVIVAHNGILTLLHIPMLSDVREPGDEELGHNAIEAPQKAVDMAKELLRSQINEDGFDWESYEDEGLKLRQDAVDRILSGDEKPVPEAKPSEPVPDIMDQLQASMDAIKEGAKS